MTAVLIASAALATVAAFMGAFRNLDMVIGQLQARSYGRIASGFGATWIVFFLLSSIGIGLIRLIWQAIAR